jgi:hypothetical protein
MLDAGSAVGIIRILQPIQSIQKLAESTVEGIGVGIFDQIWIS